MKTKDLKSGMLLTTVPGYFIRIKRRGHYYGKPIEEVTPFSGMCLKKEINVLKSGDIENPGLVYLGIKKEIIPVHQTIQYRYKTNKHTHHLRCYMLNGQFITIHGSEIRYLEPVS